MFIENIKYYSAHNYQGIPKPKRNLQNVETVSHTGEDYDIKYKKITGGTDGVDQIELLNTRTNKPFTKAQKNKLIKLFNKKTNKFDKLTYSEILKILETSSQQTDTTGGLSV